MRIRKIVFRAVVVLVLGVIAFYTFKLSDKSPSGEALANQYCSTCHQFPSPDLLTKESWNYLLTYMGFHLGIRDYSFLSGSPRIVIDNIRSKEMVLVSTGTFPSQPVLTPDQWKAIRKYYEESAPEKPIPPDFKKNIIEPLDLFDVAYPDYSAQGSVLTLVKIDEARKQILLADNKTQSITFLNDQLKTIATHPGYELIVDVHNRQDSLYVLSIGDLMGRYVSEERGYIFLSKGDASTLQRFSMVKAGFHRPSSMEWADLDNDGKDEIIVSNFGDVSGSLEVLSQDEMKNYTVKKVITKRPGIIKSSVHDFDRDGRPDIAVLMGDARENVTIFFNKGNLTFEARTIVEFHSAYGSTFFELTDFNKDGFMDIITVNGDSDADPYNTLKRYHGIRIFLNDGNNVFAEKFFYPMHGAHFARSADFDEDGDMDIAAVSFFPDFDADKPENFTFLENTGDFSFKLYSHPLTRGSRWMVMDIGDYDGDRDIDIVLGAAYLPLGMAARYSKEYELLAKNGKPLLILQNKTRQPDPRPSAKK